MARFLREEERQDHHRARQQQQQEVGARRIGQFAHHDRLAARFAGDLPCVVAGQRHADEVHQIVACEGQRQREGARQNGDAHDVEPHALENPEHDRRPGPEDEQRYEHVLADVFSDRSRNQPRTFQPLEQREVEDSRQRNAAPYGAPAAEHLRVAEREDEPRNVHEERPCGERQRHREQDGRDDGHRLSGVDVLREVRNRSGRIAPDVVECRGDSRAQQSEYHRHGGRGGQSEGVVNVQQQDVAQHHAQKEHHDLREGELSGIEDAAARHLHHAARRERADEDAGGGDPEDDAARCGFRSEGRVEKVDRVVGHAHDDAHHGQQAHDDDDACE